MPADKIDKPRCSDCRFMRRGALYKQCRHPKGRHGIDGKVFTSIERMAGDCGPTGRNFEPPSTFLHRFLLWMNK